MTMFYIVVLVALIIANAGLAYHKHRQVRQHDDTQLREKDTKSERKPDSSNIESQHSTEQDDNWTIIRRRYLVVYALAVAADWLQVRVVESISGDNRANQTREL